MPPPQLEVTDHYIGMITGEKGLEKDVENEPSKDGEKGEKEQRKANAKAANSVEMVEFSQDGQNNAAKIAMTKKGFLVNTAIERKNSARADGQKEQAIIIAVNDDGSIGIHDIDMTGKADKKKVSVISMKDVLKDWRAISDAATRKLLDGYPKSMACYDFNSVVEDDVKLKAVTLAINKVALNARLPDSPLVHAPFRIQYKPALRIYVLGDVPEQGLLQMFPISKNIRKVKDEEAVPKSNSDKAVIRLRELPIGYGRDDPIHNLPESVYIVTKTLTDTWAAEYFAVHTVNELKDSNMHIRDISTPIPISDRRELIVTIPVMMNRKKIKVGDELTIYKAPEEKASAAADAPKVIAKAKSAGSASSASKRQKTD